MRFRPITLEDVERGDAYWNRGTWNGQLLSHDGTPTDDFAREDVAAVLAYGSTDDRWDGRTAVVLNLSDGRYVRNADVLLSSGLYAAVTGLSEQARELLEVNSDLPRDGQAAVALVLGGDLP